MAPYRAQGCTRTTTGQCCVFPFVYQNRRYYKCIELGYGRSWCATTNNYDRDRARGICTKAPWTQNVGTKEPGELSSTLQAPWTQNVGAKEPGELSSTLQGSGSLNAGGVLLIVVILLVVVAFLITWICCCFNRRFRSCGYSFMRCFYSCCFIRLDFVSKLNLKTSIRRYLEYPPLKRDKMMKDTIKNRYINRILVHLANLLPEFFFSILPTGSLREGYGKLQPSTSILATDYDLMLVPDGVTATTEATLETSADQEHPPTFIVTNNEEIPKGFIWLSLNFLDLKHWKDLTIPRHVQKQVGHYLSINKMKQLLKNHIETIAFSEINSAADETTVEVNGPAITVKVLEKQTVAANCCRLHCNGERELTLFYCDFTIGIHHPKWPRKAANWFSPERRRHWPSEDVIERILSRGCHVVPKASVKGTLLKYNTAQPDITAFDQAPDLEWRYSFSQPEIELSDCIPDVAKGAFMAIKAINKSQLYSKDDTVPDISSYVLKTILLRTIEEHNKDDWIDLDAENIFRELLERLHQVLTSGICPHYWIEDINLLEYMPEERLVELARKVEKIQANPHKYVGDNWREFIRCLRIHCLFCGLAKSSSAKKSCAWRYPRCLVPCSYSDVEYRACFGCPYDETGYDVY